MFSHRLEADLPFLNGGGQLGALIAEFDWSGTGLGPLDRWPAHVRAATSLMLRSAVPIVMLWGESGVMIYNGAYAVFAGGRHPELLGSEVREGWAEVADFNDNVMKVGLAGGTLSYRDQELTLHRSGRAEQVWMNLDYSPLLDDRGVPVGVMAVVVETTAKVRAERRLSSERERFAQLFEQAPSFMAVLQGPSHRIRTGQPETICAWWETGPCWAGRSRKRCPTPRRRATSRCSTRCTASGEALTAYGSQIRGPGRTRGAGQDTLRRLRVPADPRCLRRGDRHLRGRHRRHRPHGGRDPTRRTGRLHRPAAQAAQPRATSVLPRPRSSARRWT